MSFKAGKTSLFLVLFVIAASLGSCAATYKTVTVRCPVCGHWLTRDDADGDAPQPRRSDMKPVYDGPAPLAVCPTDHFVVLDAWTPDEIRRLRAFVLGPEYQSLARENTPHFLLAVLYERLGRDPAEVARQYLEASWEAGASASVWTRYVEKSLAAFRVAVAKRSDAAFGTADVLVVELLRLLGRFDEAQVRADRLFVMPGLPRQLRALVAFERRLIAIRDRLPQALPRDASAG